MTRFAPGVIVYDDRMSSQYQSGRALSEDTAKTWSDVLAPFVLRRGCGRLLDLGAGTGRFSALFARSFATQVIGVEPSASMLAVARAGERLINLAYVLGTAEHIPLADQACDLVWLSHVWHHIADRQACASELRRVVRSGGSLLIRGTFGDQLDGYPTLFQYWPGTREICQQLPTIQDAVLLLEANGFVLKEHRRVEQVTAPSLDEFARRTRLRADTALALIPDSEFLAGQTAIEAAAQSRPSSPVIETIELLVLGGDHRRKQ